VLFALGNALMNDSWFSQTIDPPQTGSTSPIFFKWLRENKIVLPMKALGVDDIREVLQFTPSPQAMMAAAYARSHHRQDSLAVCPLKVADTVHRQGIFVLRRLSMIS
jgi:hypothetical protein